MQGRIGDILVELHRTGERAVHHAVHCLEVLIRPIVERLAAHGRRGCEERLAGEATGGDAGTGAHRHVAERAGATARIIVKRRSAGAEQLEPALTDIGVEAAAAGEGAVEIVGDVGVRRDRRGGTDAAVADGGAVDVDDLTDGIPSRPAAGDPERNIIPRRAGVGAVAVHPVDGVASGDGRFFEGLVFHHAVVANGIHAGGLAHKAVVLKRSARADRQDSFEQDAIEVEARAVAAIAVHACLKVRAVAREIGRGGYHVYSAGWITEAEDGTVGAAANLDGLDAQRIDRHTAHRFEVAEGNVGRGDAADPVGASGVETDVFLHVAVSVDGEIRVVARALAAGGVKEDVVDIEHAEVGHLLLRHHGDGGGEVLELRVEARSGHGVGAIVALGVGDDFEG